MMDALQKESEELQLSPMLRERIMSSAKQIKHDTPYVRKWTKASWLLVASLLFLFSTGFATMSFYYIRNREGEAMQQYQAAPPLSKERLAELQQMADEREKIQAMLEPGTAAAVYRVKKDGQDEFFFMERPLTLSDLDGLRARTKELVNYPAQVAKAYAFAEGSISFDYEMDESLREALKKSAADKNQALTIEPVKSLPTISHASARYEDQAGNTVHINLLKKFWTGKRNVTVPGVHQQVEEVKVNGAEGLYLERVDPFGKPFNTIEWEDEKWVYSINSTDVSLTKEQLLKIAGTIR